MEYHVFFFWVQGLFCQKTGYETATKRKEDGSKSEFQIIIPGCSVPRWLTHQSGGKSISVVLSPDWCNSRWVGFTLCAAFIRSGIVYHDFRVRVKAIGDVPHRQYVSKFHFESCNHDHVWLLYLSRDDWFSTVGNGECSQIEVVFEYGFGDHSLNPVWRCGVSLVYEQDMELMEELNQANAQCSSRSRVITFEGWDGVHHGFVISKTSRDYSRRTMKYFPLHAKPKVMTNSNILPVISLILIFFFLSCRTVCLVAYKYSSVIF